jgi:opacity protein-like surface antigen
MLCPSSALIGELVDTECLRPPVTNGAEAIVAYVISEDLRYDSTRARTFLSERRADPLPDQQLPFAHGRARPLARLVLRLCAERMRDMGYKRFCVLVVCVLALPAAAQAQEKRVNVSFGGGFTAPNSDVRDHLGNGYNFNFGVQVNVTPVIAIEGLYSFNGLGSKDLTFNVFPQPLLSGGIPTDLSADMNMQYGTGSLIVQKPEGAVRPYGLIGMGVYHRPIKVTTPGVGWVPGYCDPWWYVCYPGGWVETTNIIGERSSTDFGMGFGGGVNFGAIYAELRYHYIWGPEVEPLTPAQPIAGVETDTRKANGQFLATTFGVRF